MSDCLNKAWVALVMGLKNTNAKIKCGKSAKNSNNMHDLFLHICSYPQFHQLHTHDKII